MRIDYGEPFVGKAGKLMNMAFQTLGIKREEVYIANIVKCRPPANRNPEEDDCMEGKIELLEDLEKRLHKSLEQIVKREGYPNVQAFQKVYNKAEELIIEYNEELRAWKNQTEQKKEKTLEQPKKASVLEKLHRYQQDMRRIYDTIFFIRCRIFPLKISTTFQHQVWSHD